MFRIYEEREMEMRAFIKEKHTQYTHKHTPQMTHLRCLYSKTCDTLMGLDGLGHGLDFYIKYGLVIIHNL
jgi:hypothetical protein